MATRRTEWGDLDQPGELAACVRESAGDVCSYLGLLAGSARHDAEAAAGDLYAALAAEVRSGSLRSITLPRLRAAARRLWLERRGSALVAMTPPVDLRPVSALAELSELERTVIVLRLVNRMPVERVAEALDLSEGWVADVERRAIRRLGGDVGGGLTPWFGEEVRPRPGLADELVARALGGDHPQREELAGEAVAPSAPAPDTAAGSAGAAVLEPTAEIERVAAPDSAPAPGTEPGVGETPSGEPVASPIADIARDADAPAEGPVQTIPVASGIEGAPESVPVAIGGDETAGGDDEGSEDSPSRRKRRGPLVLIAAVVVLAALAAATWWYAGRDGDETAAPTTPPVVTAPTSTAAPIDQFAPPCVERAATSEPAGTGVVATFGPLPSAPALMVDLPSWLSASGEESVDAEAFAVDDGVVLGVRAPATSATPKSLVAAVDLDGDVRWVRCFDEAVDVRTLGGTPAGAAIRGSGAWLTLDPATGEVGGAVAEPDPPVPAVVPAEAWPDESLAPIEWDGFRSGVDGDIVVALGCMTIDPAAPNGCAAPVLRGYAASGVAPATATTAPPPTTTAPAGPVITVPALPTTPSPTGPLLLWQRDDVTDVIALRDGFALISYAPEGGTGSWYLVRVDTGDAVAGQAWGPDRFPGSCCESDASVRLDGGVLIVRDGDVMTVWPAGADVAAPATATVP